MGNNIEHPSNLHNYVYFIGITGNRKKTSWLLVNFESRAQPLMAGQLNKINKNNNKTWSIKTIQ